MTFKPAEVAVWVVEKWIAKRKHWRPATDDCGELVADKSEKYAQEKADCMDGNKSNLRVRKYVPSEA